MSVNLYKIIIVVLVGCSALDNREVLALSSPLKPTEQEMTQIRNILTKLGPLYAHFKVQAPEIANEWSLNNNDDNYYGQKTHFITDSIERKYGFTFLVNDNRLITFMNRILMDSLFGAGIGRLYDKDKRPPAAWTKERAIEEANKFLPLFNNRPDILFDKPDARFGYFSQQMDKYYVGNWEIDWNRTDKKGHAFYPPESIRMQIAEAVGLLLVDIHIPSTYVEVPGKELTEREAYKEAMKYAAATAAWPALQFSAGKLDLNTRGEEIIVRPNHLLQNNSLPLPHDLNARLAWMFWFSWHTADKLGQGQAISVWIDAHTGEYLGGDAAL
jgi:hypothetical protein